MLRLHWAARARFYEGLDLEISAAAKRFLIPRLPRCEERRKVIFMTARQRRLDEDNLRLGMKPVLDLLQKCNVIRSDHPKWVALEYHQLPWDGAPFLSIDVLQIVEES